VRELIQTVESNFRQYVEILNKIEEVFQHRGRNGESHQLQELVYILAGIQDEIVNYRLKKILQEEHPYIPQLNMENIEEKSHRQNCSLTQLAETFLARRRELLKLLYSLPSESWERTGVHEKEGHVSFKEFVRRLAEKDQQSIAKLNRAIVEQ
jgi:hypothetical protein